MSTTPEERRVLGFLALLLTLSAGARWLDKPVEVVTDAPLVDVPALLREDSMLRVRNERRDRPLAAQEKVDPNRADADALQRLPGVGPSIAAAIVAWRDSAGPFETADDLLRVRGIGPSKLGAMREHLALP
ncbi:MAG TPA: helix-hairpin-helix domain-containing protein [Longimicrobiales bacterium]|nr:helix-hairpin-helix domain-containing protein [Longimicrobiales bacterium]